MTDEKPEPADATPAEPWEVWWPKYLLKVDESVTAAEQHLEVPAGTVSSIPHEPDFVATVKTYAVVKPILNELIAAARPRAVGFGMLAASQPDENFHAFVATLNMSGRTGKLALAKAFDLLTQDQVRFIESVARIRNRYAHNVKNMHRSLVEMLIEEQTGNAKIVANLTGVRATLPSPTLDPLMKLFMYHRLADFLSVALHTLKPPPLPAGGLWSALMGSEVAGSTVYDSANDGKSQ